MSNGQQQPAAQHQQVPVLLLEIRAARKATCLAAMRDLRRLSGRPAPAGGFGRRLSLAAAVGTEDLLDGAADLLPLPGGRRSSRAALEDLLTEAARRRGGVGGSGGAIDREEALRKLRCLGDLESRYCRLLLDEERKLRLLAAELDRQRRRRPDGGMSALVVAEPAFQECLRRSQLRMERDRLAGESLLQRVLRGAAQAAEAVELTMNLDACLSVGVELYCQLAAICHQLKAAEEAGQSAAVAAAALSAGQLQPALAWWLDRAVYAQDRREVEREYRAD